MFAKEWRLKPVQENNDFDDEKEETLSLCDLALNSNDSNDCWDNEEDQETSSFDQERFEFFSTKEDFSAASSPRDNIIFCGKLIPYKGDDDREQELEQTPYQNIRDGLRECKKSSIFSWKSFSLNRSKSTSSLKIQQQQEQGKSCRCCKTFPEASSEKKYDLPAKKVPTLFTSPSKSRWYLFAFGVGRYPMEMELNDIKARQNKLSDSKMRRSMRSPARIFGSDDIKESTGEKNGKRKRGWWGLIRGFGCKSYHANAMVKASMDCITAVS